MRDKQIRDNSINVEFWLCGEPREKKTHQPEIIKRTNYDKIDLQFSIGMKYHKTWNLYVLFRDTIKSSFYLFCCCCFVGVGGGVCTLLFVIDLRVLGVCSKSHIAYVAAQETNSTKCIWQP